MEPLVFKKDETALVSPVPIQEARKGNTWLISIFVGLIIISFVVMVSLITWAAISHYQFQSQQQQQQNLPNCTTSQNTNPLVTIPSNASPCFQNNNPTSMYYIGRLEGGTYDYVVAPWPTNIQDVCVKFCNNSFADGVCTGPSYSGKTAQENYDNCITQLTDLNPGTCKGVYPIALKGAILYYAQSPTCLTCDFCV